MAPLQFRAWNPEAKQMGEPFTLVEGLREAEEIGALWDKGGYKEMIYMQATGLTDREGTMIFAGDILKFDEVEWGDDTGIFAVQWADEEAGFYGKGLPEEWSVYCTVIGNKFEHPELLSEDS